MHEKEPSGETSRDRQRGQLSLIQILCFYLLWLGMILPFWNSRDPVIAGVILVCAFSPFVAIAGIWYLGRRIDPKADQVLGVENRRVGEHPANGIYILSSTPAIVRVPLAAMLAWPVYEIGFYYFPKIYLLMALLTAATVVCLDYRKGIVVGHKALVNQLSFAPPGWGAKTLMQSIRVIETPWLLTWTKVRIPSKNSPPLIGYRLRCEGFSEDLVFQGEDTPLADLNQIAKAYASWGQGSIFRYQEMLELPDF